MPEKCPNCGLDNSASVLRCECGYDFQLQTVLLRRSKGAPEKGAPYPKSRKRILFIISGVLAASLAAVIVFTLSSKTGKEAQPGKTAATLTPAEPETPVEKEKSRKETKQSVPPMAAKKDAVSLGRAAEKHPLPAEIKRSEPPPDEIEARIAMHGGPPVQAGDGSYEPVNAYLAKLGPNSGSERIGKCTDVFYTETGWLVGCAFLDKSGSGEIERGSKWFIISRGNVVSTY